MAEILSEMKHVFKNCNEAGNVPAGGFSKEQLKTHKKAQAILGVINLAEKDLRKKASKIFDEFNVSFEYTSSDNSSLSDQVVNSIAFSKNADAEKQDLLVSVNFNFSKLGKLPAEEIYLAVYATLNNALISKQKAVVGGYQSYKFDKNLEENEVNAQNGFVDPNRNVERPTIFEYIKKILKILFSDGFDLDFETAKGMANFNPHQDYTVVAKEIEENFKTAGIVPEDMFENPKGQNLETERYGKLVEQGKQQQATFLLGEISKKDFDVLKTNNESEIKNFCLKYANQILSQNEIKENDVQITFNPTGDIGNYYDYGNRQEININLQAIKKMRNPAEVVLTLSHELQHAIDSTKNKRAGKTLKGGYGLLDNLVGDVSKDLQFVENKRIDIKDAKGNVVKDSNGNIETFNPREFLAELNSVCYRVNPNEINAREAELTSIRFMRGMMENNLDKTMQKYIDNSVKGYNSYQQSVIDAMNKIAEMRLTYSRVESLIDEKIQPIFQERLNYLQDLENRGKINPEKVRRTIEIASGREIELNEITQAEIDALEKN